MLELWTKREWIFSSAGLLFVTLYTVSGQEAVLKFQNNYPYIDVYRYQARCTLPCRGMYRPGEFNVTVLLDKICSNFEAFGMFKSMQTTPSAVWYLSNTNYINSNSQNQCEFEVQFEHAPQTPVPNGTCHMGWTTPTSCPGLKDSQGVVLNGWMRCFDVVTQQLDACYNQTVFSQCCTACNDYRKTITNCTFGDFRPWQCTSVSDEQCYQESIEGNCCETCYDIADSQSPKIEGCKYGDMDPSFCKTIQSHQCYQYANKCCESCYWMSDASKPGCLYGNRLPYQCNSISTADCYNSTTEYNCCGTCSDLRNEKYPDCFYGDKNPRCVSIERKECYLTSTRDTCCDTCVVLANNKYPECAYGDRRDCSGVILDKCADSTVRKECCETCTFLEENDCSGKDQRDCTFIEPRDCYNESTLRSCCSTCLDFYKENTYLPDDCKYGDRIPAKCRDINTTECYGSSIQSDCCETCSYYIRSDLPYNCRYGDKEKSCSSLLPYQCYDNGRADDCCETCAYYDQSDDLGQDCRYGDRKFDCYTEPRNICYNESDRKECCKFCQNVKTADAVGCEYGDKSEKCTDISPSDCYQLEDTCCRTCPYMVLSYDIDNCKYGDRKNCNGISMSDCYNTTTARECCKTCWLYNSGNSNGCSFGDRASDCGTIQPWQCYTREVNCCATCEKHVSDITDISYCKYGDHHGQCGSLLPYQCYNEVYQYQCCSTCFFKRRTDLPDTCLYGDKSLSCGNVSGRSYECYNSDRRDECCESCQKARTNIRNCEYGDKHALCKDVSKSPYLCYNKTVENLCCKSCPVFKNLLYPGCEYGDIYSFCDAAACASYNKLRRDQCCRTCWTQASTTGTTTYFSTTDYYSTATEGNPKQQGTSNKVAPIVGGVVGGVIVVAIVVIATCFCMRRKKPVEKPTNNGLSLTALDPPRMTRNAPSYFNNQPRGPQGISNLGYKTQSQNGTAPPPSRAPPRREKSVKDEEVYDYIDDSDVRTVISQPTIRKPAVPYRPDDAGGYLQPTREGNTNSQYTNPGFRADESEKEEHHYHVLEAKGTNVAEREYLQL